MYKINNYNCKENKSLNKEIVQASSTIDQQQKNIHRIWHFILKKARSSSMSRWSIEIKWTNWGKYYIFPSHVNEFASSVVY